MILRTPDARRFYKLYMGFLDYFAPKLGFKSTPRYPGESLSTEQMGSIIEYVWFEDYATQLIDEFVSRNPYKFNRTDLREIESWKEGLYGTFFIMRDGRDVTFLYGDYAFVVRGIDDEIDGIFEQVPTMGSTVLLPFAGLITYGACIHEDLIGSNAGLERGLLLDLEQAKSEGRRVSTARDFLKVVPEAREMDAEGGTEYLSYKEGSASRASEMAPDQRAGVLAGLTPEERAIAVDELRKDYRNAPLSKEEQTEIREYLDDLCTGGGFAWTLKQAVGKLDDENLQFLAERNGIAEKIQGKSHEEMIKELLHVVPRDVESLMGPAMFQGEKAVEGVRRVYNAGDALTLPDSGPSLLKVPDPCFPATLLYHRGRSYVSVMPKEVREALDHADWKALVNRARAYDKAMRYLATLVDLRGVVQLDEALEQTREYAGNVERGVLYAVLFERIRIGGVAVGVIELDGKDYVVSADVSFADLMASDIMSRFGEMDVDELRGQFEDAMADYGYDLDTDQDDISDDDAAQMMSEIAGHNAVRAILEKQEDMPPCEPTEQQMELGVLGAAMETPEAQALVAYFDAHVPDGEDEYFFATDAVEMIVESNRDLPQMGVIFDNLADMGYVPTAGQVNELTPLLADLSKVVPKWMLNGWTPVDMAAESGSGQRNLSMQSIDIKIQDPV